ncbi:protein of unknown function [Limnospira indica PCC 8005]|uniref:Uncharacterized protein n=1 Tax=Limnospira indica PCC 8005 TaxID=376219 RepID=A0A9P1KBF6_9CYAN|nr:protein of unknown function [Limnospira indica PCC 8005]
MIVSHHTAPDVDTLLSSEQGYYPLLSYFNVQSFMQHVVFQLVLATILLIIAVSISTP